MGKVYAEIPSNLQGFIERQHIFFVGTAPLSGDGHVNISPKGLDTLRILSPAEVAYLDLTGSGVETIAHVRENQRIVLMFCAFEGVPNIVRVYGRGSILEPGHDGFEPLVARFPSRPGIRAILHIAVTRVSDSCGYAVPRFEFVEERDQLLRWAEKKGPQGLARYRVEKNERSIDGLPGLPSVAPVDVFDGDDRGSTR